MLVVVCSLVAGGVLGGGHVLGGMGAVRWVVFAWARMDSGLGLFPTAKLWPSRTKKGSSRGQRGVYIVRHLGLRKLRNRMTMG